LINAPAQFHKIREGMHSKPDTLIIKHDRERHNTNKNSNKETIGQFPS
jgi:hypothetical protein